MKKIAIGNIVNIKMDNCIIETDIIEIKNTISSDFSFKISRNNIDLKTVAFPLEGVTLLAGDFLDYQGIHKKNQNGGYTLTEYTSNQLIAFQNMSNINISKGNFYVSISNTNAIIKLYYYKAPEEDEQIYVLDKNEELIAVFNVDDKDTIFNPRISETQNSEATFTFSISPNNPKWKQINNPENLYVADGKVFSTNFEGCFQENISENNEDYITITAYERQKLLSRRYVKAWNSEDGFENIDTFMVVVLSKGNLPLKNGDYYVNSNHLPGTSGYALDALLFGTDWHTGTCDVEGIFDLETDQVDIYENILKVQQIWGGILVFDSVNKIIHHRDETKWLPYNGYEVKYQKNMQSLEKLYNNKIITKLCPLGEGGLNIKKINNNSEWITNFSYTDSILEGIENNPDITDQEQLKKWGERKLKDLCKPRKELTVNTVLLYQVEGFELEQIGLNDIVDVINYANIDGDIEQLRVVGYEHGLWDASDATIELSDITLDSTDIFKKTVSASNSINNGTLNSKKIVNFFKNGQSVSETIKEIDKTITDTQSAMWKADEEIGAKIEKTEKHINSLSDEIIDQKTQIERLLLTVQGLENQITTTGGSNLIRNSVGNFDNEYWEGTIEQYIDTDVMKNNESKSSIRLKSGSIHQGIKNLKNGQYNISFNYKKIVELSTISVIINGEKTELAAKNIWTPFEKTITITDYNFDITFKSDTNNSCLISDLILIPGTKKQYWNQNANETNTETVKIGEGIQVESTAKNNYTRIDADGNRTFNKTTGVRTAELTDWGIYANELEVKGQAKLNVLLVQEIDNQAWITGIGG
ncbi:MAG: phage tail protein [Clostridium sp.]|nr:phage tail protein [Clostridium sp.]